MRSTRFACGLLAAAIAAGTFAAPAPAADISKYLPDGTLLVVTLNLKQLMDAPLVKQDEQAFKAGMEAMTKALEGFGVNPAQDLSRVILAGGADPRRTVLLLEGNFDADKFTTKIKELVADKKNNISEGGDGAKVKHFKFKIPPGALPQPGMPNEFVFAHLDKNFLVAAADVEALEDAVAKRDGKKADVGKEIVELIGKINPKQTLSLVVVPAPEMLAGSPVDGLTSVTGGVTVADGIKTDILLATKDGDTAKNLAQMITEGLNQVKQILPIIAAQQPNFGPKEQKMVQDVMDTFKATAAENGVMLRGNITKEFIEKNAKRDK
jgi:hypothetical protein